MTILNVDKHFVRFEDITPELLKKEGVKLLLCDLDNTIRLHSEKEPSESLKKWVRECQKAGVTVMVVSNNGRKKMMQRFCEPMGIDCVWWAMKPISTKLTKAVEAHGCKLSESVMLGDKWTTDVIAAHFAKIRAWKVNHRRNIKL